jgi:2-keto-4-pentenoate hydratase/2-oxohepta-3-ene-1,7-dioic acid hydratase in catechol pathway
MRLVSYGRFGGERAGFLDGESIVDLETALQAAGADAPFSDMRVFLEQPTWRALLDRAFASREAASRVDSVTVRLGCPVPVPRTLTIVGANTKSHIAEAGAVLGETVAPREPMLLAKATSSLCGAYDDIILPPETRKLDYEVELGVIIGRKARRIGKSDVKEHVAGFTVINEVSARDIQLAEHEKNPFFRVHYIGKSFDTFCPAGPALVTVDEFSWGKPLKMSTKVNGEIRQQSDTSDLYFGIEELVSYASRSMTLYPGDIIATGSPAGVAFFMKPPRFLQAGDVVRCEIEGVGMIENTVRAERLTEGRPR